MAKYWYLEYQHDSGHGSTCFLSDGNQWKHYGAVMKRFVVSEAPVCGR